MRHEIDQDMVLSMYAAGAGSTTIAKTLGAPKHAVIYVLKRNYIKLRGVTADRTKTDTDLIVKLYESGKSCDHISSLIGIKACTVRNRLLKNNIQMKSRGMYRQISVDDNAFSELTPSSCYWAGFIAADGNVQQGNYLNIKLKGIDAKHLEKFGQFSKFDGNVSIRHNEKWDYCKIAFRSRKIVDDLCENFSIIPNKSLVLQPPHIDDLELIRHFIRGYFDGDGCFYFGTKRKVMSFEIYSGSKDMVVWILDNIKKCVKVGNPSVSRKGKNVYRFQFCGNRQVVRIMEWLYWDNNNDYLDRKYIKFFSSLDPNRRA